MMKKADTGLHFLKVAEGARHLGVSGIRLREAALRGLIPSQRDNEGALRVDLSNVDSLPTTKAPALAETDLLDILFDEIEELQSALSRKEEDVAGLTGLVKRQGAALARAEAALDPSATTQREAEMQGLLDRALALLEVQQGADQETSALRGSAEKAMNLLERALKRAEEVEARAQERADALTSELEAAHTQLEKTMALSERAIEQATRAQTPEIVRAKGLAGLWARLFGR